MDPDVTYIFLSPPYNVRIHALKLQLSERANLKFENLSSGHLCKVAEGCSSGIFKPRTDLNQFIFSENSAFLSVIFPTTTLSV
jgi:hypothetical protein